MKSFLIRVICIVLLMTQIVLASENQSEIFRQVNFTQACTAAKAEGKIVMIDFFTTWCVPCKALDKHTWTDNEVRTVMLKKAVSIKLDAEKEGAELAKTYRVRIFPTILFLKPDGTEIDRMTGFRPPKEFLEEANGYFEGKDSLTQAREKLAQNPTDLELRLKLAKAFESKKQYKQAFDEYVGLWQEGVKKDPEDTAIPPHLQKALIVLGSDYPPAMNLLREQQTKAEAALLAGNATSGQIQDFLSLNQAFGEKRKTLEMYDRLRKTNGKPSEVCGKLAKDILQELVEAQRYADITESIPNIPTVVEKEITRFQGIIKSFESSEPKDGPLFKDLIPVIRSITVETTGNFYETLLATGKTEAAAQVADQLIKFHPSIETFVSLIEHAKRVKNTDAVALLMKRGIESVPASEHAEIQKAAEATTVPSK